MHVWLDLIVRELLFVALLAALGAGPAAFLPDQLPRIARIALAPVLGLCVGASATVTLVYWFTTGATGWVVLLLAVGSLALFVLRSGLRWRRPSVLGLAQVALVVAVILVSYDVPMVGRDTVGPVGGFVVGDTTGYVSETNGEAQLSIREADRRRPPYADLANEYWATYAQRNQQLDISALEANVNSLLGLNSLDTQSPFLIAVLLAGALGAFAAVRSTSRVPTWAAALTGCLFAGPLFAELYMDGSQAAITGSSLLAPIAIVGLAALRDRRVSTLALLALLAAGLQTVYPLFVPPVAIGAALVVAVIAVRRLRRGRPPVAELTRALVQIAGVLALGAAFTPVAFARNARYWISILKGSFSFVGLPVYKLGITELPSWTLQTRGFYGLVNLLHASTLGNLVTGGLAPLLLIAIVVFAVDRSPAARVMLAMAIGASLLALYAWRSQGCSYCVQRNLIPIGALGPSAIGIGVAALAMLGGRRWIIGSLIITVVVLTIGRQAVIERLQMVNGGYLLDPEAREAAARIPAHSGPVEVEGFSEGTRPPMELPLIYNLVEERTGNDASYPTLTDDGYSLFYLTRTAQPLGPSFRPGYRYVMTRLASIATQRQTVARYGPIALQRRTHRLDVTLISGVRVAPSWVDPAGLAWVEGPLRLLVVGGRPDERDWVSLVLRRTVPVRFAPGVSAIQLRGGLIRVCVAATGTLPVRQAVLRTSFRHRAAPPPEITQEAALPPRGLRLAAMSVSASSCLERR